MLGSKHQIKMITDWKEQVKINGVALERVTSTRNLGLILDEEENYGQHVNNKITKDVFSQKTVYKIKPYIKEKICVLLTEFVLSQLDYCRSVFRPWLNSSTEQSIHRVQNACVRFYFNVPKRERKQPT